MIPILNLDLGHLIDTLSYLTTPTAQSCSFLITFSWIMKDYPISLFSLSLYELWVRIWGLLGQGIGDLDSGLTILYLCIDTVGLATESMGLSPIVVKFQLTHFRTCFEH